MQALGQACDAVIERGVRGDPTLQILHAARPTGAAVPCLLNCTWPPGRSKNMTSWLATRIAMSCPISSSTNESARSSPAVTPAAVRSRPSRT